MVRCNGGRLDAGEIVTMLRILEPRIAHRSPEAGLAALARDLITIGEHAQRATPEAIAAPNTPLRWSTRSRTAALSPGDLDRRILRGRRSFRRVARRRAAVREKLTATRRDR
jgi:hypothetical protein